MKFMPYGIESELTPKEWLGDIPESVKIHVRNCASQGWRFYPVNQKRGRCYYNDAVITIPMWVIRSPLEGKKIWYISHEIAHVYTPRDNHGSKFMARLREICPKEFQHWEIGYKPRNAIAAGITDQFGF